MTVLPSMVTAGAQGAHYPLQQARSWGFFAWYRGLALAGIRLGAPLHLYFIVLALAAMVAFLIDRLNNSRLGRALAL